MKVRFTMKELAALREVADITAEIRGKRGGKTDTSKAIENLIQKMENVINTEGKAKPKGTITVQEFLTMARLILGPRLKEQLLPTGMWYKQMQFRIDSRNITKAMANVALENCRDTWRGDVWVDTLINSLDKLAVMTPQNKSKTALGWLNQLEKVDTSCDRCGRETHAKDNYECVCDYHNQETL